jgi:hypothetical protein
VPKTQIGCVRRSLASCLCHERARPVGSAVEVGRSRGVVLSFPYWMLRRLLELLVLRLRSEREKEVEILALRHQLRVLERQVGRAQFQPADRALLARGVRKLGHARERWSCGCFVFVDEAAEDFASVDVDRGCAGELGRGLVWRLKRERAVRPVPVVMGGVEAEHLLEVAAVDDQNPVEALAAEGADPSLGVRIRIRSSDRCPDDPHALAAEDLVAEAPLNFLSRS